MVELGNLDQMLDINFEDEIFVRGKGCNTPHFPNLGSSIVGLEYL